MVRQREPGWMWHHMGTTRMDPDPKRVVVNVDGRVHGIGNLFVAGSSVFPTSGNHTPTLTIIAMTFRVADGCGGSCAGHRWAAARTLPGGRVCRPAPALSPRRSEAPRTAYGSSTVDPVVLRASRSRCACAASANG